MTDEEKQIAKKYCEALDELIDAKQDEDGYIILFDKKTRTVTAYNGEEIPPEKQEVISAAASIAANDDYIGALNKIIAGFGGSPVTISDSDDDYSYYDYSDNDYTDYDFGDYDE